MKVSISAKKIDDSSIYEKLNQKVGVQDLQSWAEDVQLELKRLLAGKLDSKEFTVQMNKIMLEKVSRPEIELIVDKKISRQSHSPMNSDNNNNNSNNTNNASPISSSNANQDVGSSNSISAPASIASPKPQLFHSQPAQISTPASIRPQSPPRHSLNATSK